jgi:hypothetical protein
MRLNLAAERCAVCLGSIHPAVLLDGDRQAEADGLGPSVPSLGVIDMDPGPTVNPDDGPATAVPGALGRAEFPEPPPVLQELEEWLIEVDSSRLMLPHRAPFL